MQDRWIDVSAVQQKRKAKEFYRFQRKLSQVVHGFDFGDEVLDFIFERHRLHGSKVEDPRLASLLTSVAEMYSSVTTPTEKRRALSLVVNDFTYGTLLRFIPNLSQ